MEKDMFEEYSPFIYEVIFPVKSVHLILYRISYIGINLIHEILVNKKSEDRLNLKKTYCRNCPSSDKIHEFNFAQKLFTYRV